MADLYQGQSGQIYVKLPGNRYEPVSQEQAAFIQERGLEAFTNSALNSAAQVAVGIPAIFNAGDSRQHFQQLQQEQAARSMGAPLASFAGSVAPDVAVGALTGGAGSLARRMALTGLVEGGLGAARNPENPLGGAALQGGLGAATVGAIPIAGAGARRGMELAEGVISRSRSLTRATRELTESPVVSKRTRVAEIQAAAKEGRTVRALATMDADEGAVMPLTRGDDSMGAARAENPNFATVRPVLGNTIPSERMWDDYGFPTSEAQAKIIDTGDTTEFQAARFADKEAFDEWRSSEQRGMPQRLMDAVSGKVIEDYGALQAVQQSALNKEVMRAMGSNANAASRTNLGDARRDISKSFSEITRRAKPIDGEDILDDLENVIATHTAPDVQQILANTRNYINEWVQETGGKISGEEMSAIRNEISEQVRRAYGKEPNLLLGDALRDFEQALDKRLFNALDAEDQADFKANRFKWAVNSAALRTAAATNARGDINIRSFINSYRRGSKLFAIGRSQDEFARFLDTADAIMFKESRDSGTPAGVAPAIAALTRAVANASGLPLP